MAFHDDLTTEWADEGLISDEQAEAIRVYEHAREPTNGGVREVLGYVGSILVLVAGLVLVSELWTDMKRGGRIALSGLAAATLVATGLSVLDSPSRSTRRMGEVALMLAAAPVGMAVGLTFGATENEEPMMTMAFAGATAFSAIVYRWRPSWAQHIALMASAIGLGISLGITVDEQNMFVSATLVGAVGLGLLAASWHDRLPPRALSETGALVALGLASVFVVGELESESTGGRIAMAGCIALSVALITAGVRRDRVILIAGGALGLLGYLPLFINDLVPGEAGGTIALLVAGLVLIGTAVVLTRRQQAR